MDYIGTDVLAWDLYVLMSFVQEMATVSSFVEVEVGLAWVLISDDPALVENELPLYRYFLCMVEVLGLRDV